MGWFQSGTVQDVRYDDGDDGDGTGDGTVGYSTDGVQVSQYGTVR